MEKKELVSTVIACLALYVIHNNNFAAVAYVKMCVNLPGAEKESSRIVITVKTKTKPVQDGERRIPIIGRTIVRPTFLIQRTIDTNKGNANGTIKGQNPLIARRHHNLQTVTR